MRVFRIEDGEIMGTFHLLSHLRFDADSEWYVERDDSSSSSESLHDFNISLDEIRTVAGTAFPEFDEVRSWTPVSTEEPIMEDYVAFGPNDKVALVVHVSQDNVVETMHLHIWFIDDKSTLPEIVELFSRIAARWELLFETLNTQQVVSEDKAALTDYVNQFAVGW